MDPIAVTGSAMTRPASGSSCRAAGQHAPSCATGQSNAPPGPKLTFDQAAAIAGFGLARASAGLRARLEVNPRSLWKPSKPVLRFRRLKRLRAGTCLQRI